MRNLCFFFISIQADHSVMKANRGDSNTVIIAIGVAVIVLVIVLSLLGVGACSVYGYRKWRLKQSSRLEFH